MPQYIGLIQHKGTLMWDSFIALGPYDSENKAAVAIKRFLEEKGYRKFTKVDSYIYCKWKPKNTKPPMELINCEVIELGKE